MLHEQVIVSSSTITCFCLSSIEVTTAFKIVTCSNMETWLNFSMIWQDMTRHLHYNKDISSFMDRLKGDENGYFIRIIKQYK